MPNLSPAGTPPSDHHTWRRTTVPVPVPREGEGRVALAARECGRGGELRWGEGRFVAASVMKVNILAALLLRARTEGRSVSEGERAYAAAMIERSDNDAANALWAACGGADGVRAANRLLGPRRTEPHRAGRWGLSLTTPSDQLALLGAVYGEESPLVAEDRAYVRELMAHVVESQRWGVPSAGGEDRDAAPPPEVKNGWLPRTATGLWVINSVGRVTTGGRAYLVAVLSDGHRTRERGIEAVEEAARAAVSTLRARPRWPSLSPSPRAAAQPQPQPALPRSPGAAPYSRSP